MKTQQPGKPDASQDIQFPLTFLWELEYPAFRSIRIKGCCRVDSPLAYELVMEIFQYEIANLGAIIAPLILVPSGKAAFCSTHGSCGSYEFCTVCGCKTEYLEPELITSSSEATRFCPEHEQEYEFGSDKFFCGYCGRRTMIKRILNFV